MTLYFILSINKDIVQIYNNKDIKFFYQYLIDIFLKCRRYIS